MSRVIKQQELRRAVKRTKRPAAWVLRLVCAGRDVSLGELLEAACAAGDEAGAKALARQLEEAA